MGICKSLIRNKGWWDSRTDCANEHNPIYSTFERWNSREDELSNYSMDKHLQSFGMEAYRTEQREIAFLRKIYYQHGKVKSSTVEKIIANRTKYMDAIENRYEPSDAMLHLLTENHMSIQAWIESMNEWKPDLKKLEKEAVAYFKSRLQIEKNFEESIQSYISKPLQSII